MTDLTADTIDIEAIVREVIRRLRESEHNGDDECGSSKAAEAGTLRIDESVVTLATLEGRLDNVRQLVVRKRTIVTPSVKDLLREQRIEMQIMDRQPTPSGSRLVVVYFDGDVKTMIDALSIGTESIKFENVKEAIERLKTVLSRPATKAIVVTANWAVATCWANRHTQIRAVCAPDVAAVTRAAKQVDANMLVVDTQKCGNDLTPWIEAFIA